MKKEGKKEKENNYTIRILWNVAPFILPSGETNGILRKLSCENAMKLNPRERSGWRLCSTILSLSLSYIRSCPFLLLRWKTRNLFRNGSNDFIEVRRVYLGIYHDVAAAAQLCLFKQREMEQKRKRKIKKKIVAVSRATGLRTIGRKT